MLTAANDVDCQTVPIPSWQGQAHCALEGSAQVCFELLAYHGSEHIDFGHARLSLKLSSADML